MAEAHALLREIREVHETLQVCFRDLEKVLFAQALNPGALTSVRLKLAGIRLSRGPLITRIATLLQGNVTEAEERLVDELRLSHNRMLRLAMEHTGKWTLEAIATNWPEYRRETRDLVRRWTQKAERDQRLVLPLLERCASVG